MTTASETTMTNPSSMGTKMMEGKEMEGKYAEKSEMKEKHHHKKMEDGRMLTMPEIVEKLHGDFEDEIHDANKYMNMSECAEQMEHHEMAHYLCEMAKDEYTHAAFIHKTLMDNGINIDLEAMGEWKELESRFRREFR